MQGGQRPCRTSLTHRAVPAGECIDELLRLMQAYLNLPHRGAGAGAAPRRTVRALREGFFESYGVGGQRGQGAAGVWAGEGTRRTGEGMSRGRGEAVSRPACSRYQIWAGQVWCCCWKRAMPVSVSADVSGPPVGGCARKTCYGSCVAPARNRRPYLLVVPQKKLQMYLASVYFCERSI